MELEIKNLDFETFVKMFDNLIIILNTIEGDLERIADILSRNSHFKD